MFGILYDIFLTLFYPRDCFVCKNSVESSGDGVACKLCWSKTRIFTGEETICRKCGKLHPGKPTEIETYCHECDDHFYDIARSAGIYESALSATVLNLKKETFVSKRVQSLIADSFRRASFQTPALLVPVPLSKKRVLERGFNQAILITKIISKETGIGFDEKSLVRTRHAKVHRAGMDRRGRELSVEKSFEVAENRRFDGETIILIDDVLASGATVSACAKLLKRKGASKVFVFTLARAT